MASIGFVNTNENYYQFDAILLLFALVLHP